MARADRKTILSPFYPHLIYVLYASSHFFTHHSKKGLTFMCVQKGKFMLAAGDVALEGTINTPAHLGDVFVKIRQDEDTTHVACCLNKLTSRAQNDKDAALAMTKGAGMIFQGRPCRTEMVRANRTFILRNYVGGEVSLEEARSILQQFGAIGRLEEVSSDIAESLEEARSVLQQSGAIGRLRGSSLGSQQVDG
ncbi:RNA recognition domain-containing protein [Apiospora arundinis]|uniref:RNA recognition domain-containing protein n=1 Tax=Apiospora arundinis TaxID=335852 RepID=A0ABR2I8H0_9PEZI